MSAHSVCSRGVQTVMCKSSHTLCTLLTTRSQMIDGISNLNYVVNYTDLFAFQQCVVIHRPAHTLPEKQVNIATCNFSLTLSSQIQLPRARISEHLILHST